MLIRVSVSIAALLRSVQQAAREAKLNCLIEKNFRVVHNFCG